MKETLLVSKLEVVLAVQIDGQLHFLYYRDRNPLVVSTRRL